MKHLLPSFLLLIATLFSFSVYAEETSATTSQRPIRVAVYDDGGVGKGSAKLIYRIIQDDPNFVYQVVNGEDIRNGILDKFDMVALPGGSGKGEAKSMGPEGVEKVKQFVHSGHGYFGVCAGAYFPIQQNFVNIQRRSTIWTRGKAVLDIELTEQGRKVFGEQFTGLLPCHYGNGPVMNINIDPNGTKVEVLAWFRSETANGDCTPGIQINSPAIVYTTYGTGPMILISPHPEGTKPLYSFIPSLFKKLYSDMSDEVKAEVEKANK